MCLTETYSKVRVGKNLSDRFPIRSCLCEVNEMELKQGSAKYKLGFKQAAHTLMGAKRLRSNSTQYSFVTTNSIGQPVAVHQRRSQLQSR
jgi:hypothetical protein